MAFAQSPKPCELCEVEYDVKYKCIECGKFMCERCKGVHKNVPTLSNHHIAEIKNSPDIHHFEQKIQVDCIVCSIHNNKFYCLYCKTCNELVCPDCVSGAHLKHDYEPIIKACENKIENLHEFDAKIEKELKQLKKSNEFLRNAKSIWELDIVEAHKSVDENELLMKEAVAKHANELRRRIEQEREIRNLTFETKQNQIDERNIFLSTHSENLRSVIESRQGEIIFATETDISKLNVEADDSPLPTETIYLSSPKICTKSLENIFGTLCHSTMSSSLDLAVSSNYSLDQSIDKMVISHDDQSWLSMYGPGMDTSHLVKTKLSKSFGKLKPVTIDAFDMAVMMDDTLLVSVHMTMEVKKVTKDNSIEPFIDVSPLLARGIAVNQNDEVILGVREKGDPYEITDHSCRQILVFSSNGIHIKTYEFDENNQRLMTIARRVCVSLNGDIIINDSLASDKGRIVCVGKRGEMKWIYDGQYRENAEKCTFDPDDMVATSLGYIVLADECAHTVYILSLTGDLLLQKNLTKFGIAVPRTVAFDHKQNLWIGCATHRLDVASLKKKRKDFVALSCIKLICKQ